MHNLTSLLSSLHSKFIWAIPIPLILCRNSFIPLPRPLASKKKKKKSWHPGAMRIKKIIFMDLLKIVLYDKQVSQHRTCLPFKVLTWLKKCKDTFSDQKINKSLSGFQLHYNQKHYIAFCLLAPNLMHEVINTSFPSWIIICSVISPNIENIIENIIILQSTLCLQVHKCMNCCKERWNNKRRVVSASRTSCVFCTENQNQLCIASA